MFGRQGETFGFSNVDTEFEEECYPQTLYTWNDMEVEGCVGANDEVADLFEAGEDVVVEEDRDKDISRPTCVVKNTIDSDAEQAGKRPDVLAGVDDEASQDAENACKFTAVPFL